MPKAFMSGGSLSSRTPLRLFAATVPMALVLSACGGSSDGDKDTSTTPASGLPTAPVVAPLVPAGVTQLRVGYSLVSVNINDSFRVPISALKDGKAVTASVTSASADCLSAKVDGDEDNRTVLIQAKAAACNSSVTVSAEGVPGSTSVSVQVIDPKSMDIGGGLTIAYTNEFDRVWDSWRGSDRDDDPKAPMSFFKPKAPAGYRTLGSMIHKSVDDPSGEAYAVVVKDTKNNGALADPTGFDRIWHDVGTNAEWDGSLWKVNCPSGYVAFGTVAVRSHDTPATAEGTCVNSTYARPALRDKDKLWDDSGSGAKDNLEVFLPLPPKNLPKGDGAATALYAGTFIAMDPDSKTESPAAYLMVPLQVTQRANESDRPKLTSCRGLDPKVLNGNFDSAATRVPFSMLGGKIQSDADNAVDSPFYYLERRESWAETDPGVRNNCDSTTGYELEIEMTQGVSSTSEASISQSIGMALTVGAEVSGDVPGVGSAKTSMSLEVSTSLSWSAGLSKTYSEEKKVTEKKCIPPRSFGQFLQRTTTFRALNSDFQEVSTLPIGLKQTDYLEFNEDAAAAGKGC